MPLKIEKNGFSFNVANNKFWDSFLNESWEPTTLQILDKYLKADDIMVDIGAWIGPISLYAGSKVNHCFSFEPDPTAYAEFNENYKLNPQLQNKITLFNKAITQEGKPVRIFSRHAYGDSGSSLLKRVKSKNEFVEVSSTTFDQFLTSSQISKVHFIKMDIEGGEFFVLPSMVNFLKSQKPKFLLALHFAALTEYLELKYFPLGALRRIYRFLDPQKVFLKDLSARKMKNLLDSFSFYQNCRNGQLEKFDYTNATPIEFENLDMLFFD